MLTRSVKQAPEGIRANVQLNKAVSSEQGNYEVVIKKRESLASDCTKVIKTFVSFVHLKLVTWGLRRAVRGMFWSAHSASSSFFFLLLLFLFPRLLGSRNSRKVVKSVSKKCEFSSHVAMLTHYGLLKCKVVLRDRAGCLCSSQLFFFEP